MFPMVNFNDSVFQPIRSNALQHCARRNPNTAWTVWNPIILCRHPANCIDRGTAAVDLVALLRWLD